MNPILVSALFGFFKSVASPHARIPDVHWTTHSLTGPMIEELTYRAMPLWATGGRLPRGLTALPFAMDHIVGENKQHQMSGARMAGRFADTFFGGLLYESAFRQFGLFGAIASHCAHNLACIAGTKVRR